MIQKTSNTTKIREREKRDSMIGKNNSIKRNRKKQRCFASIVLVFALLLQTLSPVLALGEGSEDPRVVVIAPQENGIPIYGDEKFISVTGVSKDSVAFPEITYFFDLETPLDLPDGDYTLTAHFLNLYGTVDEQTMPN